MSGLAPGDGIWSDEADWRALDAADSVETELDVAPDQPVLAVVGRTWANRPWSTGFWGAVRQWCRTCLV
jgi:putative SOS response-associated peptidase YedK